MINAFPSGIEAGKVTGSLRKGTFLEKSLPVVTLGAVGVLGSELMSFSSLSPGENQAKALGEAFLEAEEAETSTLQCNEFEASLLNKLVCQL